MSTTHHPDPQLTQLQQEVAELWARYRKDEPRSTDDEARRVLAEQNRTLEAQRRRLSDRSAALRLELEQHRRRASRLSPVVRVFGGLVGTVQGALLLGWRVEDVAALSLALTAGQGVVVLLGSLLVLGLSTSRVQR